ncbi:MAG: chemotaxis protein CheC [Candidatus Firestonebacteria bacterium]
MKKNIVLTQMQLDALSETASIGVSHSATALSKMLNKKILIKVPQVSILPLIEFPKLLETQSKEDILVGIYFRVLGKASGRILITYSKDSALALADVLMKRPKNFSRMLTAMDQSALEETGTILTAACLNALADFLEMTFIPSVPQFAFNHTESLVQSIFDEVKQISEYLVVVESEFIETDNKIKGKFFIFPDANALEVIWKSIGVKS